MDYPVSKCWPRRSITVKSFDSTACIDIIRWASLPLVVAFALSIKSVEAAESTPLAIVTQPCHIAAVEALAFSGDGNSLFSGGRDKVVKEWRNQGTGWRHRRDFRWNISRSLRGRIRAIASSPNGAYIAFGGYGWEAQSPGAIYLVDTRLGGYQMPLKDLHGEEVQDLVFSSDGKWLAGIGGRGKVCIWRLKDGKAFTVQAPTSGSVYHHRIAYINSECLIYPRPSEAIGNGQRPQWELGTSHPRYARQVKAFGQAAEIYDISSVGRILAVASPGNTSVLNFNDGSVERIATPAGYTATEVEGLSENRLLEYSQRADGSKDGIFRIISLGSYQIIKTWRTSHRVQRMVTHEASNSLAYVDGEGHLHSIPDIEKPEVVIDFPRGAIVKHVSAEQEGYGVRLTMEVDSQARYLRYDPEDGKVEVERTPARVVRLGSRESDRVVVSDGRDAIKILRGGMDAGTIRLDSGRDGYYSCHRFLYDIGRKPPVGIAIGTDLVNDIHLYDFGNENRIRKLRRFRGHLDSVTSIDVTSKRDYLVSGSADGTIRFWSLIDSSVESAIRRQWGITLGSDGLIRDINPMSPLFHKGAKRGDRIEIYQDSSWLKSTAATQTILGEASESQRIFRITRTGEPPSLFALRPAWFPILSCYALSPSEWLAWHPNGYFDQGPAGNELLGWHTNVDYGKKPVFALAEQYSGKYDNPELIRRLLPTGKLKLEGRVADERLPQVSIRLPGVPTDALPLTTITADVNVKAEAILPRGEALRELRLLINGVPINEPRAKAIVRLDRQSWSVKLVPGTHVLSVEAETISGLVGRSAELRVAYDPQNANPKFRMLAVGVSQYQQNSLDLRYAARDAQVLKETIKAQVSGAGWDAENFRTVVNSDAQKKEILEGLSRLVENLGMDDVAVFFFSGHGVRDEDNVFYFLPHDADPSNLAASCISEDEIMEIARSRPHGYLVLMIDACHSGNLQSPRPQNQDGLLDRTDLRNREILAITSSRGDEKSYELEQFRLGAFTHVLDLGLKGEADRGTPQRDGVDYVELCSFTEASVQDVISRARELKGLGVSQTPMWNKPSWLRSGRIRFTKRTN